MPQLSEMRDPADDWTGVTSTAERKRRQNRLHQRAYRRRKRVQPHPLRMLERVLAPTVRSIADDNDGRQNQQQGTTVIRACEHAVNNYNVLPEGSLLLTRLGQRAKIHALMQKVYEDYSLNAPRPAYLQVLIRLNVLNALARNATALGFPVEGLCRDEFISPFNEQSPHPPDSPTPLTSCPKNLLPTTLQRTVKHHPWIDLFPVPRMRDNMLLGIAAGAFDEDELCGDVLNVEDEGHGEKPSLIVWTESWDLRGWEASIAFLRKWGGLIRGCPEILEATNYWREKRGERKLIFEVGL